MTNNNPTAKHEQYPMLRPRVEKVVINMCVGKSGESLEKAKRILRELTDQNPCDRKAKMTIREFGIRKGEPIASVVTLRKKKATEFLKKVLSVVDNKISRRSFDRQGNFSFGIKEHIEIPGTRYEPEIGIFGMDVCVSLSRPGYRVNRRRTKRSNVGSKHTLTPEEASEFVKDELGVEIA